MKEKDFKKVLEAVDEYYINSELNKSRLCVFIICNIMNVNCSTAKILFRYKNVNSIYNILKNISDVEKEIATHIYEECILYPKLNRRVKQKKAQLKELEKELNKKIPLLVLNYVEVASLSEANVFYRFYENGIEEKVVRQ